MIEAGNDCENSGVNEWAEESLAVDDGLTEIDSEGTNVDILEMEDRAGLAVAPSTKLSLRSCCPG